jgi:predicted nucleic acid-binding protein
MTKIIVDSNIIAKTFSDETDSQQAKDFLKKCVQEEIEIIAPDLLRYEIAQISIRKNYPMRKAVALLENAISSLVSLRPPTEYEWLQAEIICQKGHEKSGFPSMYDSVYHAIAIVQDGVFITADKKHYAKTKEFKHIVLLKNWESIF